MIQPHLKCCSAIFGPVIVFNPCVSICVNEVLFELLLHGSVVLVIAFTFTGYLIHSFFVIILKLFGWHLIMYNILQGFNICANSLQQEIQECVFT